MVRAPLSLVLLLCLAVVGGTWWYGTRDYDFLTPPADLPAIKPAPEEDSDQMEEPNAPEPPALDEYRASARTSPQSLAESAASMEARGDQLRALLYHERILDSVDSSPDQIAASASAVLRLRAEAAEWNIDPNEALPLTLHIGTGETHAEQIAPIVLDLAERMTMASSGIVMVRPRIHRGSDLPTAVDSPPVAVWMTGRDESSEGTAVLSFTIGKDEEALAVMSGTVLRLMRTHIAGCSDLKIPASGTDQNPSTFTSHVTRLVWQKLGKALNEP